MLKKLSIFLIVAGLTLFFFLQKNGKKSAYETSAAPAKSAPKTQQNKTESTEKKVSQNENSAENSFSPIANEADFLKQFPGEWNFRRNDLGKIHAVTGGLIPQITGSPDRVVALVKALAPFFAKGEFDVEESAEKISDTQYIRSFQVSQTVNGRRVYQGSATVLGRNSDDSAYIVNNRMKDVFGVADEPLVNSDEAANVAKDDFRMRNLQVLVQPVGDVVVFSDDRDHSELAYVFQYSQGMESGEIVIGAETGQVLHQEVHSRKN